MIRILIGALAWVLVTTPALARNITKEVQYFRNVDVVYSEKAHVCGFKDREPYPMAAASPPRRSSGSSPIGSARSYPVTQRSSRPYKAGTARWWN